MIPERTSSTETDTSWPLQWSQPTWPREALRWHPKLQGLQLRKAPSSGPDLASKNTGHPVKFKFPINNKFLVISRSQFYLAALSRLASAGFCCLEASGFGPGSRSSPAKLDYTDLLHRLCFCGQRK